MPVYQASGFHLIADQRGSLACRVTVVGNSLEITLEKAFVDLRLDDCRFRWGGLDEEYVEIRGILEERDIVLYVREHVILEDLLHAPVRPTIRADLEDMLRKKKTRIGWKTKLALGTIALLVVLAIGGHFGLQWATDKAAQWVPVEWQIELGRAEAWRFLENQTLCLHPRAERMVNEIATRLITVNGPTEFDFHVILIDSPAVNAFALPGGMMIVSGALLDIAGSPDEIAGVLAHEMAHITLRHGVRNVLADLSWTIGLKLFVGETDEVNKLLLKSAAKLVGLAYSRDQEYEADMRGMELAQRAGFNPAGMVVFFERLKKMEGEDGKTITLLSTHPETSDRQKVLLRRILAEKPVVASVQPVAWIQPPILCARKAPSLPEKGTGLSPVHP